MAEPMSLDELADLADDIDETARVLPEEIFTFHPELFQVSSREYDLVVAFLENKIAREILTAFTVKA